MVRIKLMDGSAQEISRDGVLGVFPCAHLFRHPALKSDAVVYHGGKILPVLGPLPPTGVNAWILFFETHGQVIASLPEFEEDAPALGAFSAAETEEEFFLKSA